MGELWNLVDSNGIASGIKHERDSSRSIPDGLYHLAVEVWFKTDFNELLLTQRHPDKPNGLKWECTCGSALYGESSFEAAQRELFEELGISVSLYELEYLDTLIEGNCLVDVFLVQHSSSCPSLILQAEEVVGYKLVDVGRLDEIKDELREDCWRHFQHFKNRIIGEEYYLRKLPMGTCVDYFPSCEDSTINLYLTQNGYDRMGLIKYLKDLLGIGFSDVQKTLSDLPALLLEDISQTQAWMIKKKLSSFGADAEIKYEFKE